MTSSSRFVDRAGDGYQNRTAWAGQGTGVLVLDADGDGKISRASEFAFTEWDATAKTDFEGLRHVFDTNGNGKLDAGDARWSEFRVEVNGQLVTLDSLGITSIDLTPTGSGQSFADGSAITGTTTFTRSDGTTGIAGDAVLAADGAKYIIRTTNTTNADGSVSKDILAYNADGSLAFHEIVTTSADGNTVQTQFDDDGNGTFDRTQSVAVSVAADGVRTKTVSNFNADGSLADRTTTVTSADLKTVTKTLDRDGDGVSDERQVFVRQADGSSTTTTETLSLNGTALQRVVITAGADGLTKTSTVDINGDGATDLVISETTVIAADGSRTKTVDNKAVDGTLLSKTITTTSTDVRTITVAEDEDGNGTFDSLSVTVTAVATNGDITAETAISNGDGSLRGKTAVVTSANGLSKAVSSDVTGDGNVDVVDSDITIVSADGSRTQTVKQTSGDSTLLSKTVTATSADRKTITIATDANGDGATDSLTSITVAADGTTTRTASTLNADGSLVSKTVAVASADGLSKTTTSDANGDGSADRVVTDVITGNADGSRTETVTTKSGNGSMLGRTVTTTTADSLSHTVQADLNGDDTCDQVATDTITLGSDGSRSETVSVRSADGTLTGQTTTVVSADRQTTTVTTDADGDGHLDSRQVKSVFADGHVETTRTDTAANGAVLATRKDTVSADGLTKTSTSDVNGDGITDQIILDRTVLNADGSRTETISLSSGNGTLLDRKTIVTSGNGLSVTTTEDVNGDGTIDLKTTEVSTLNNDGSVTKTVSHFIGTKLADRATTVVSANGLTTQTSVDAEGDGAADRSSKLVRTLSANGSVQTVETIKAANTSTIASTSTTVSADRRNTSKSIDLDGNGETDVQETISVNATGLTTDTVETYKAGALASRAVTSAAANGLSKTSSSDLDGDGVFDKVVTETTTLDANGSQTRVVSEFGAGSMLTSKTTLTASGDGLTKTAAWADGTGTTVRSMSDVTMLNADGGTTETLSYFKAGGALERRTVTTVAAHGLSTTVEVDLDGDSTFDQRSVTTKQADGSAKQVLADLTTGGIVTDTKTVTVSADGLTRTVDYDTDGNCTVDNKTTSVTALNADGSKTTTTEERMGGVLKSRTVVDASADGLAVTTKWDTTGTGSFDKRQTDLTVLNADGSRARTVSLFNGATLASRHLIITSANGLATTEQWDLTGSGTYGQSANDVTVLDDDGTTTRTATSSKADGTLISRTITTTDASGRVLSSSDERPGFGNQTRTDTREVLADGTIRQTATTSDTNGHLIDRTVTTTSADKLTVTVERDANGDGIVDQRQQSVTANSGILTSTTTDFNTDGTVRDRSIRTVSADGRHTTITWDYDGNGSNERQRSVDDLVHADGSRTTVTTDTDLATGSLAAKTTTVISADGRSVTTSKDVNGDGTVDQVETVTIDSTGATKTVVTNNATARNVSYLTAGGVYWAQAIAAKSETSTSADGQTKTIRYDYDGDGVFDVTMQSLRQVDGSIVTTVTETTAAGAIVATGTIFTSADGRIAKLTRDVGNNGSVDHTEMAVTHADGSVTLTKADFNASGVLTQTIVDTVNSLGSLTRRVTSDGQGRKTTQVDIAADGSSATTAYDAASGQTLSISRANKAGVLTSATLYDPLNAQPWTRVEQQFDAQGKKTTEVQYKDDGTRAEISFTATGAQQQIKYYSAANVLTGTTDFDVANANNWSKIEKSFNAAGQLTTQVTTNDDATKVQLNYDPVNTAAWSTYQQNFNATGQLTFIDQTNDNGTHNTVTYDVANAGSWSRYEQYIDSAGRVLNQTNFNDNGTRDVYSYDPTNTVTWSTYVQSFNTAGQLTVVTQYNDNGTRYAVQYDPTNVADWGILEYSYDAAGRQTNQVNHYDNGNKWYYTWDVVNAQTWSLVIAMQNVYGQAIGQINYFDNGTRTEYNWDPQDAQAWGIIVSNFTGASPMDQTITWDDGKTTLTQYDYNNTKPWVSYVTQRTAGGMVTSSHSDNDDGTWTDYTWDKGTMVAWTRFKWGYDRWGIYTHIVVDSWKQWTKSPVLLDLDGDGHVDLRPLDPNSLSGATSPSFDWDGDGTADNTAWAGSNDGFLAIDLASNGVAGSDGSIDQSRELAFTDWVTPEQVAANGGHVSDLDALRLVFDTNHDNMLDANDDRWSEFRVWRDANQNGITDTGELMNMSEAGIKLINLLHTPEGSQAFADGSAITGTSSYETVNGEKYLVADASLAYRAA